MQIRQVAALHGALLLAIAPSLATISSAGAQKNNPLFLALAPKPNIKLWPTQPLNSLG